MKDVNRLHGRPPRRISSEKALEVLRKHHGNFRPEFFKTLQWGMQEWPRAIYSGWYFTDSSGGSAYVLYADSHGAIHLDQAQGAYRTLVDRNRQYRTLVDRKRQEL